MTKIMMMLMIILMIKRMMALMVITRRRREPLRRSLALGSEANLVFSPRERRGARFY